MVQLRQVAESNLRHATLDYSRAGAQMALADV